jgi:hypothetical protein
MHWRRRREKPECNNGIRDRDLRQQVPLGSKRTFNKTDRQILGLENVKRADEIPSGLRKMRG